MAMTAEEIEAAIDELEVAKRAKLTGKGAKSVSYGTERVDFSEVTVADISQEITRLKIELAKLTGECSGVGPIRVGFGSRL